MNSSLSPGGGSSVGIAGTSGMAGCGDGFGFGAAGTSSKSSSASASSASSAAGSFSSMSSCASSNSSSSAAAAAWAARAANGSSGGVAIGARVGSARVLDATRGSTQKLCASYRALCRRFRTPQLITRYAPSNGSSTSCPRLRNGFLAPSSSIFHTFSSHSR